MKVALVCTGLGNVWRGYEKFTAELFECLKPEIDITLFKGGGCAGGREVRIPNLRRDGRLARGAALLASKTPYYFEALSFTLFFVPYLLAGRFDLIHYVDPPLGNALYHLRRRLRFKGRMLYTNGIGIGPEHCGRAEHVHQASPVAFQAGLSYGFSADDTSLIPMGLHCERFLPAGDRRAIRGKHGIPDDKVVLLSVSALNRSHKRIDYVLREVASLGEAYFLVVAGRCEDATLEHMARELLGDRFLFITRPLRDKVAELYRAADLMVHGALEEGFGYALVEAMCARLPLIAHAAPHFAWLVPDDRCRVDMACDGALAARIREFVRDERAMREAAERNYQHAVVRFDWAELKDEYIAMYRRALSSGGRLARPAR